MSKIPWPPLRSGRRIIRDLKILLLQQRSREYRFAAALLLVQLCACGGSNSSGGAPPPPLTVGLDSSVESGSSTVKLVCPPIGYLGPDSINGYAVCQAGIADVSVTVSGTESGILAGMVLFDSGTPGMVFNVPAGAAFPAAVPPGTSVTVATPSGFSYAYTAGSGSQTSATTVQPDSTAESIVGVGYFTSNSFFIDFSAGTAGWK
jgi:hypothetical protein